MTLNVLKRRKQANEAHDHKHLQERTDKSEKRICIKHYFVNLHDTNHNVFTLPV